MSLLALYVSFDSSFLSTQFSVLNLDGWFDILPNLVFSIFDIFSIQI